MKKPIRSPQERLLDYETRGSQALADGNELAEAGRKSAAEKKYDLGQYWLDKANALKEKHNL